MDGMGLFAIIRIPRLVFRTVDGSEILYHLLYMKPC